MKKIVALIVLALFASTVVVGCGDSAGVTKTTKTSTETKTK